jgi:hypothetical protein
MERKKMTRPPMSPSTPCTERPVLALLGPGPLQGSLIGHAIGRHGGGIGQVHSQHTCTGTAACDDGQESYLPQARRPGRERTAR